MENVNKKPSNEIFFRKVTYSWALSTIYNASKVPSTYSYKDNLNGNVEVLAHPVARNVGNFNGFSPK